MQLRQQDLMGPGQRENKVFSRRLCLVVECGGKRWLPRRMQVPQMSVRRRMVEPASSPIPVATHSSAVSSLLHSPEAVPQLIQRFKHRLAINHPLT